MGHIDPTRSYTPEELEYEIGSSLRRLRINRNLEQSVLAERAGISTRALRNLELGNGSSLHTLVCVVRALGRQEWFGTIGPIATINPLMMTRDAVPRQRASKPRPKKHEAKHESQ
ncbi:helix-turn-helix domain-containing protein [Cupriavidus sp. D384]|uniref:helix-turn-helix domain-containing protein n=1 Tax=Cupriavidus sp. D384 TaxID=1538095 RepID=UPI00082E4541|nr:helix-turn-helix transcriptional regulator [Cupriavidus sp. D384]